MRDEEEGKTFSSHFRPHASPPSTRSERSISRIKTCYGILSFIDMIMCVAFWHDKTPCSENLLDYLIKKWLRFSHSLRFEDDLEWSGGWKKFKKRILIWWWSSSKVLLANMSVLAFQLEPNTYRFTINSRGGRNFIFSFITFADMFGSSEILCFRWRGTFLFASRNSFIWVRQLTKLLAFLFPVSSRSHNDRKFVQSKISFSINPKQNEGKCFVW